MVEGIFADYDTNGDGKIDFNELVSKASKLFLYFCQNNF
jgi:Ca2+-binding EF-hand superfamily protein